MTHAPAGGLARRLAANTLHAASGRVVALAAWLVLTPPMLRALGPEAFGVWSLFFALTGWLQSLDVGLAQATLRWVAAAHARGDARTGGEVATLSSLGYLALGLLWVAITPLAREPVLDFLRVSDAVRPGAAFAFTAGAVVFAFSGLTATVVSALQGSGRFDLANVATLTVSLGQAAGIVVALRTGAGLVGFVVAAGAGWAAAWLVGLALLARGAPGFRWGGPRAAVAHAGEMLRFGGPMQLANMLGVAHQQLDKVLLARFVSVAAVAPYELGLRVSTAAATFSQLLLVAMIPAASAFHASEQHAQLRALHARASRYVLTVGAAFTAVLVGGAGPLLEAWLGAPDPAAERALQGLAIAAYFAIAAGVGGAIARGVGRTDLEAEFSAVAIVVHVALGLALVPRFHLDGALAAIVAGNAVAMVWFLARLASALGWPRASVMLEPVGVPFVAIAAGGLTGFALAGPLGAMPGGWPRALVAAVVCGAASLLVSIATRFLPLREALALVRRGAAT